MLLHVFSFLVLFPVMSSGQDFPSYPDNTVLKSYDGDRSAIHLTCVPHTSSRAINCTMFQHTISYKIEPNERDAKYKEQRESLNLASELEADELVREANELCQQVIETENEGISDDMGQSDKRKLKKITGMLKKYCPVKNIKSAEKFLNELFEWQFAEQAQTCRIWTNVWQESFRYETRSGGNYWLSSTSPSGQCGIINISTLKKDQDSSLFWIYESKRIVTNKEADAFIPCSDFEERTTKYGWKSQTHDMSCEHISFGLF